MALTLDGSSGLFAKLDMYYRAITDAEATTGITDADRRVIIGNIREAAQRFLIRAVQADTPIRENLDAALDEVVRQAIAQSESVDDPTSAAISGAALSASNLIRFPNEEYNVHTYDRRGQQVRNQRPCKMRMECVRPPIRGQNWTSEWTITSSPVVPVHESGWFSGNPFSARFNLCTAQIDGIGHKPMETMLTNGGFERFTSNVPDNWTLSGFTAGTHVASVASPYIGTTALKLIGDGSTTGKVRQILNDPSGSLAVLQPRTWYTLSMMLRRYSTGAITGVVRMSIEDASGNELYSSGKAGDLSVMDGFATYTYSVVNFFTGDSVSATNYAVIETTTAMGNTHELYVDEIVLLPMLVIPGIGRIGYMIEGTAAASIGDNAVITATNDGTSEQLMMLERLFDFSLHDLCMPTKSDGSETITDAISVAVP